METAVRAPQTSSRFCAPDADISILSSDGVLFKVHRKNLEVHSDIFADAANATRSEPGDVEIVHLTETAEVLELLLQYMYRQRQPYLGDVKFATFANLAEAAEKYMVYSALDICQMKMKDSINAHPLEVFLYAVRHGYVELANESARRSMGCGFADALEILPPDAFKAWVRFKPKEGALTHSDYRFSFTSGGTRTKSQFLSA
ncbi:hypothetical protein B0H19DRAFT_1303739 [Mycena capillaripes]|nr:hypothetical protein B0H19DRAFT_1303739 [Mycena capillaripes]